MVYDIVPLVEKDVLTDYCLAEISDFGALQQRANRQNIPVIALTRERINAKGTVLDQIEDKKNLIVQSFEKMANVILELVR
jgi:hypothetical protein